MICSKCGKIFLPEKPFCPFCGELNTEICVNKKLIRRPASDYEPPAFSIVMHKQMFPDPETGYDEKADEFFKPEPTSEEKHQFEENMKIRKKTYFRFGVPAAILSIMIIALAIYSVSIAFNQSSINISGVWRMSSASDIVNGSTYTFTNDGFVTVRKTVDGVQKDFTYSWRIDNNDLAVDKTTYKWNTDLNSYHKAKKNEHFWYMEDATLYLSTTDDPTGYRVLSLVD